uniref:TSA: Wollemia nobilis Ref_Wollemi_Transcript_9828_949 transcribed RNA sequence n=1 Tax=Wollemia nobilis TaxID=56998 RepID=A0A0C9RMZ7_9CONI
MNTQTQEESSIKMQEEESGRNEMNIVVAVNESQESMRACLWACTHLLATQTNVRQPYKFTLLHAQAPICVAGGPAYIMSSDVCYLLELDTKRSTQKILKQALNICKHHNVKANTHVVIGLPKERICEAAQKLGANFLVMGSRDHGVLIRLVRESLGDYCSRNAMCPVIVVNEKVYKNGQEN